MGLSKTQAFCDRLPCDAHRTIVQTTSVESMQSQQWSTDKDVKLLRCSCEDYFYVRRTISCFLASFCSAVLVRCATDGSQIVMWQSASCGTLARHAPILPVSVEQICSDTLAVNCFERLKALAMLQQKKS